MYTVFGVLKTRISDLCEHEVISVFIVSRGSHGLVLASLEVSM